MSAFFVMINFLNVGPMSEKFLVSLRSPRKEVERRQPTCLGFAVRKWPSRLIGWVVEARRYGSRPPKLDALTSRPVGNDTCLARILHSYSVFTSSIIALLLGELYEELLKKK